MSQNSVWQWFYFRGKIFNALARLIPILLTRMPNPKHGNDIYSQVFGMIPSGHWATVYHARKDSILRLSNGCGFGIRRSEKIILEKDDFVVEREHQFIKPWLKRKCRQGSSLYAVVQLKPFYQAAAAYTKEQKTNLAFSLTRCAVTMKFKMIVRHINIRRPWTEKSTKAYL